MNAIFKVSSYRNGGLDEENQRGMIPTDADIAIIVPHEGDLKFTKERFGKFLAHIDDPVLDRLSRLEADNGAQLTGEGLAVQLSKELGVNVMMMRFMVDRVFLDGNRWQLQNPNNPKDCALRPIIPNEMEAEAVRAVESDFAHWNRAVRMVLAATRLSVHPHTYSPTGTAEVLNGVGSIAPYIQSHVFPKRDLRPGMSPVTFRGRQHPKSPIGVFIQHCFKGLPEMSIGVGWPYGGDLPNCMATDVLKDGRGIVFEANQFHLAENPDIMLERPWDMKVNPEKVSQLCVNPCANAVGEWWVSNR